MSFYFDGFRPLAVPSAPTAPLEVRNLSANSVTVEWGVPETDGGAPLQGYNIAIRDEKKTMWMEVGRVGADVHKFNIKDLQVTYGRLERNTVASGVLVPEANSARRDQRQIISIVRSRHSVCRMPSVVRWFPAVFVIKTRERVTLGSVTLS